MSFGVSCHLAFHVILAIIAIIVTKVFMALMLKVVIEDRCVFKKWLLPPWIVIGRYGYKSSFGANNPKYDVDFYRPLMISASCIKYSNLLTDSVSDMKTFKWMVRKGPINLLQASKAKQWDSLSLNSSLITPLHPPPLVRNSFSSHPP